MTLRAAIWTALLPAVAFAQARFEVATIKPMALTGEGRGRETTIVDPGTLTLRNVTLSSAIQWAYDVKYYQVSGPGWINDRRYEISAKAAQPSSEDQMRAMLRTLLAERFKLAIHHETKELTVYAITVAKGGLKMTPADSKGQSVLQPNGTTISAKDTSVGEIVDLLSRGVSKLPGDIIPPVVDMTGLTGRYNFTVDGATFMQAFAAEIQKGPPDPSSLVDGVQEVLEKQLGLHADLRKARLDLIVVDSAEQNPASD